jgi:hypothetical protein
VPDGRIEVEGSLPIGSPHHLLDEFFREAETNLSGNSLYDLFLRNQSVSEVGGEAGDPFVSRYSVISTRCVLSYLRKELS